MRLITTGGGYDWSLTKALPTSTTSGRASGKDCRAVLSADEFEKFAASAGGADTRGLALVSPTGDIPPILFFGLISIQLTFLRQAGLCEFPRHLPD